jgi:hypothetical protein
MRNNTWIVFFLLAMFLTVGFVGFAESPFLPGVTVADDHPKGCVDCHKNEGGGRDYRLNTSLAADGHVDITAIVKNVPQDCGMCHREGVAAGPLTQQTHKSHYQNPAENVFVNNYQGACLNCHKLDVATGAMSIKSGPKNW